MLRAETNRIAIETPLDPVERISEALFGLIMVLTFTCSMSATSGHDDVHTMLHGAVGCNLVWGVIDAVMFLMACLAERAQGIDTLRAVRRAATPAQAQRIIAAALPPVVAAALQAGSLEAVREEMTRLEEPARPTLQPRDWLGALAVFLWVFLVTLPVAVPFLVMREPHRALRFSNVIAVALLFVMGRAYGRSVGINAWWTGLVMVLLGSALVAATIALGG
jgi:hypothetical protein